MKPLDDLKRALANPRTRPLVLGGAGVAAGAAVLALRRPTDPDEAAEEDAAAEAGGSDGSGYGPAEVGVYPAGTLPPVYALGGGGDAAFQETDLSGVYAELDALGASTQASVDRLTAANARLRARSKRQAAVSERQAARIKRLRERQARQAKRIRRVARRTSRPGDRPRSKKGGGK